MVPKIGTVCNEFRFACCVNHTRLALANCCLRNSLWDRKPSPPNSKKEKRKPSPSPRHKNPHPRPPPPPVRSPFTPAQAPLRLCHGTAYRGGKHLARRLPSPPGYRERIFVSPTAFRHFRLPPPIAIDFLDAPRSRPSSARLGNLPY